MAKSAEAKAAKQAEKAAKSAEKAEVTQLKGAQAAELKALKNEGVNKSVIKAEKTANKTELKDAKALLSQAGIQSLKAPGTKTIFSSASTYGNTPYAEGVGSLLQKAAANYDYGIAPSSKSGDTRIGTNLRQLVNYELGEGTPKLRSLVDRAKDLYGKNLTADELAEMGIKVKEVKKQPGLYKYATGDSNDKTITYFKQNDDGTFSSLNTTRSVTPEVGGLKGFMASDLGKIASIAAAVWGGPALGSYLAGAGTALGGATGLSLASQAGLGGALIGGTTSGLSGGGIKDILKGAAIGGIGGYGGQVLKELAAAQGIGGLPLMEGAGPAPIVDRGILPSLGEGAFDLGGFSGTELAPKSFLPSLGEGAFDLGGITGAELSKNILPSLGQGAFDLGGITGAELTPKTLLPSLGEGAFDLGGITGDELAKTVFPDGLSYDPGPGYGTGTPGGMLGAEELIGSITGAGGTFGMGLGAGAAGASLLDKAIEKAKSYLGDKAKDALGLGDGKGETNWPAILAALFGAGMGLSDRGKGTQPGGYQGGIPTLTATRGPAGDPLAGGRRAGGAGIPILTGGVTYAAEGGLMDLARGGSAKPPRYLDGHTDGMADKIQTDIDGKQPARLSHGEFVIPADVVSHLGNGNSDAGAKVLYQMMAKVRRARTGNSKQGKQINPGKFVPV